MSAVNAAPASVDEVTSGGGISARERLLEAVLERSWFLAALTDDDGIVEWASPAFCAVVTSEGGPMGRSLFSLGDGRGSKLVALLAAVRNAPHRQAIADIDVGTVSEPHIVRVTAEKLAGDTGDGVLWWQTPDVTPERIDRLTNSLLNIAREVEWVGFGRRRRAAPNAPIGLLSGSEQLTDRERVVATMLAQGDTVATIASRLYVSPSTVRNYLSSMYRKFAVHDLAGLRALLARGGAETPVLRVVGLESTDPG